MALLDSNLFPQAAEMIYEKRMTDEDKNIVKAWYIEALINFLDIFAQTEVGEGVEIDMMKVALYVNSAVFENQDVFLIRNIDDIYERIEFEALNGLPLWRFLKLTQYQQKIFENMYGKTLKSIHDSMKEASPCFTCIWYGKHDTMFGVLERCEKPSELRDDWRIRRESSSFHPEDIKKCKHHTTIEVIPEAVNSLHDFRRNSVLDSIEHRRQRYLEEQSVAKDIYPVPAVLSEEERIDFEEKIDPFMNLAQAFKNKKTKSERKSELRKAMYIEGCIRFFAMYANCELGNNFVPDITNIILYVDEEFMEHRYNHINSMEDVYKDLEKMILAGTDITNFVKAAES